MASLQFYPLLGLTVLTIFADRIDRDARLAAARNRQLALFKNDICYTNRFSSGPPVFEATAACQVTSDQGPSLAYQRFEQELQRDPAMKAKAEQELQQIGPRHQGQLRNHLRQLNRANQKDNPNLPPPAGQDGW